MKQYETRPRGNQTPHYICCIFCHTMFKLRLARPVHISRRLNRLCKRGIEYTSKHHIQVDIVYND